MAESVFEKKIIAHIMRLFPGAVLLKNDSSMLQGIPDRLVLWEDRWAMLEIKDEKDSPHQPNQDYYVDLFNRMSFSRFIYPENKERVLNELQRSFRSNRIARRF